VKAPPLDELALLPEPIALQRNYDSKNFGTFRLLLVAVGLTSLVFLAMSLGGGVSGPRIAFYAVTLFSALAFATLHREAFFARYFRQILIGYLFFQVVCSGLWTLPLSEGTAELGGFLPIFLIFFRLRVLEQVVLYGSFWVAQLLRVMLSNGAQGAAKPPTEDNYLLGITVMTVLCLAAAVTLTQVDRRRFLEGWRREQGRSRERLRMREEIEYARKIQLSMLPQGAPDLGWLDFSAASLPATEVGGDYYDYFRLSPTRLALVIADVAGHGLASGLLISGVRSCLYVLEDDLASPAAVFDRLNRMVRRTGTRRTYVTMSLAVIERPPGQVVLTCAGHPPLLHWRAAAGEVEEVGRGALPLGTGLAARFEQDQRAVGPDDVILMYTDGLVEARNERGQEYGDERLRRAFARAAGRSAREVRDSILSDLANFKGNTEQSDDITLVVARLR
jgi:serine phosphatase RsbU (regulator of sigma subunit)